MEKVGNFLLTNAWEPWCEHQRVKIAAVRRGNYVFRSPLSAFPSSVNRLEEALRPRG